MIHMTVTPVILTNDPIVGRYSARISQVFKQIGILMPLHWPALVFDPRIPAVWQKTTENLLPVLRMPSQHGEWISVTSLCKATDIFRTQ
jgi:hypothetical protein